MSDVIASHLLSRLDAVQPRGRCQWVARCPGHDDRSPSLSIRERDDGTVLLHCFAGCETADVLAAIGLNFSDLYPDPLPTGHNAQNVRSPRLNGWVVIDAISYRLTCITLLATKFSRGESMTPDDWHALDESIIDVQTAITEARHVR